MTEDQAHLLLIYEAAKAKNPGYAASLLADAMFIAARVLEASLGQPAPEAEVRVNGEPPPSETSPDGEEPKREGRRKR